MKKNYKIAGIISVICIIFGMSTAYAAQHKVNYIKALDGEYINISGNVESGAGREVFLRVDYGVSAFTADTQALEDYVIYQEQTTADENGGFVFRLKLKDTTDNTYTLRLGVLGDDENISETFIFYGESFRRSALSAIQAAQKSKDTNALSDAITSNYANLYLDTPVFDKYYSENPDLKEIKVLLINYPLITTISKLEESLDGVVIVNALRHSGGFEGMKAVFDEYDSKLGIKDASIYKTTFSKLSDDLQNTVYKNFIGKSYYTPSDIKTAFTLAVVNTYLSNAVGAASVKQMLSDNAQMLGIDMSDYDFADERFLGLIGTEFKSVADVKTKLEALKKNDNSNKGGGGGGGGSSSNSTSHYSAASVFSTLDQNALTKVLNGADYPFDDMEEHVWAKEATLALYTRGVLHGVGERKFAPQRVITREEFLKLIINGFEIEAPTDADVSFSDVDKNEWYYQFVKTGVQSGIIKGMDNNKFGIGNKITRQDLVVMLYRAISVKRGISSDSGLSGFKDYDTITDYAQDAVLFAESNYIVSGMGDGNFHPKDNATRAETAVILYRAIEYLSNNM